VTNAWSGYRTKQGEEEKEKAGKLHGVAEGDGIKVRIENDPIFPHIKAGKR